MKATKQNYMFSKCFKKNRSPAQRTAEGIFTSQTE